MQIGLTVRAKPLVIGDIQDGLAAQARASDIVGRKERLITNNWEVLM